MPIHHTPSKPIAFEVESGTPHRATPESIQKKLREAELGKKRYE
jgi:hypothetical protein